LFQILDTGKLKINEEEATWDSLGSHGYRTSFKEARRKSRLRQGAMTPCLFAQVARAIDIMRLSGHR